MSARELALRRAQGERNRASPRALFLIAALFSVSACAPRLMKLPPGPGAPAPDAAAALADATRACAAVSTITAEIGGSGSIAGQRFRARMTAGLAPPASVRLEAAAPFGAPLFILVAAGDDATLLMPHDNRVLEHGRPQAVLEALAGLPVDGGELRRAMLGCPARADAASGRQAGEDWRLLRDGADEVYVRREGKPAAWRVAAIVHQPAAGSQWRAEYRSFQNGLPTSVRFVGAASRSFDVRLSLSQVETNVALGPEVFRVQIPPDAERITIDELKRARPGVRED